MCSGSSLVPRPDALVPAPECRSPVPTTDTCSRGVRLSSRTWTFGSSARPAEKAPDPKGIGSCRASSCSRSSGASARPSTPRRRVRRLLPQLPRRGAGAAHAPGAPQPVPRPQDHQGPPREGAATTTLLEAKGAWVEWMRRCRVRGAQGRQVPRHLRVDEDTVQAGYPVDLLINHNVPILVSGNTGTGKTILVRDRMLNGIDKESSRTLPNFSAQIVGARRSRSRQPARQGRKGVFGPPRQAHRHLRRRPQHARARDVAPAADQPAAVDGPRRLVRPQGVHGRSS